jgi:putative phosphoesterase
MEYMRVGICSDTHDNLALAKEAVNYFETNGVDAVLHCGDIVSPFTAMCFDGEFSFHATRGNNDGEWKLASIVERFGTYHGEAAHLQYDDMDIAMYHGTSEQLVDSLCQSGVYDIVARGHTHEHGYENRDGTIHLNPGGLPITGADGTYHVAIVETESAAIEFKQVNAP